MAGKRLLRMCIFLSLPTPSVLWRLYREPLFFSLLSSKPYPLTPLTRQKDNSNAHVRPHTLPAPVILAAHLAPHLNHHQQLLTSKLSATQAQNAQLFSEIQAQRAEIEALLAGVEGTLADMDAASGLLEEVVGELVEETRAAEVGDVEMGGV